MTECNHANIVPTLSAQTSLMHIAFHIFGFKCEDCDKNWDIGDLADALRKNDSLERTLKLSDDHGLLAVVNDLEAQIIGLTERNTKLESQVSGYKTVIQQREKLDEAKRLEKNR